MSVASKCFQFRSAGKIVFLVLFLTLIILPANALIIRTTFDSITPDMPYPIGYKEYLLDDTFNSVGTRVIESLTLDDFSLLAYKDGFNLSVTSLDSDCDDTQSTRCVWITFCLLTYGQAQCHSYAESILRIHYAAYRPSVSATNPIRINAYVGWEVEGDQADSNWNCGGTEYANFYIEVYNFATNSWNTLSSSTGTGVRSGEGWYNITITSQNYVSTSGELWYRIRASAYDCHGREEEQDAMCGSMARAQIYVDYIEYSQNVPDTSLNTVCVQQVSSNFPQIWSDVSHNDTINLNVQATSGGSAVQGFPIKLYAVDEWGREQMIAVGVTDSTGTTPYFRIIGGEGYRMNFSKISAWDAWIINNNAYVRDTNCGNQTITPPANSGRNIAVVPANYVLTLVGRMYYPGGVDWGKFVWYVDDKSVQKYRSIPISQKFTNKTASFSVWKYGFDYECTDNSIPCNREGIYGDANRPYWNPACIVIGDRDTTLTPFCDRPPVGLTPITADIAVHFISITIGAHVGGVIKEDNCYVDTDPYGNPVGKHRCGLFYGYRVGPLIMMAIPDNALGFTTHLAIESYGGTLASLMNSTTYNQHEGQGTLSLGQKYLNICGMTSRQDPFNPPHTEYVFSYPVQAPVVVENVFLGLDATGTATLQPDRRGALGLIGFIGLYGDQKHVVGLILGHRFGIHPFVALVQTVPEYPTTQAGWGNYEDRWLYYLFENLEFIAKTWGKEMSVWNYRYHNSTMQANLVRAFEDLIVSFTPFLRTTLNLMTAAPQTLIYPFVTTTFLQLGDFGHLMKVAYANATILNKATEASMALMTNLPGILGPPPPACNVSPTWNDPNTYKCYGLNFIWSGSELLSYKERELFAYRWLELFDTLTDVAVEVMKAIPQLENPSSVPRWDFNWIYPE